MKKLIAVVTLAAVMMFAGLGTAFAASSPTTPDSVTPTITGTATGTSGSLTITPDPNNPDGGPTSAITVKVNDDGSFTIDSLTFTKPGTYNFTVTDPNDPSKTYTLTVVVDDDMNATYSFSDASGNPVSTLTFAAGSPVVKGPSGTTASGSGIFGNVKTSDIPMYIITFLAAVAAVAGVITGVSRRRASQL